MKRCPTCRATYPDEARFCAKDQARLAPVAGAVTSGWDAVAEPVPAAAEPKRGAVTTGWDVPEVPGAVAAAPAAKPGGVTSGWDIPDVPAAVAAVAPVSPGAVTSGWDIPDAPADEPQVAMPAVRPAPPMKASPVARKTLFGVGAQNQPMEFEPPPEPVAVAVAEPVAAGEPVVAVAAEPVAEPVAVAEPVPEEPPAELPLTVESLAPTPAPQAPIERAPESTADAIQAVAGSRRGPLLVVLGALVLIGAAIGVAFVLGWL